MMKRPPLSERKNSDTGRSARFAAVMQKYSLAARKG
jgi:hypothetical protein